MENTNMPNIQRALPIIRQMAQEAGKGSNLTERATRGAQALLPHEILGLPMAQPSMIGLDLTIAHRSTITDGKLSWDRGMEEVGPDLLALAGCEQKMRMRVLQEARTALVSQPRTPLEQSLLKVLESAAIIAWGPHNVLSMRIVSLFQTMPDHEIQPWQPGNGAWIKSGQVEITVQATPDGEIAFVELRLRQGRWRLPSVLGEALVERFKTL